MVIGSPDHTHGQIETL